MGKGRLWRRMGAAALGLLLLGSLGCETGQSYSRRRLIEHQAMLDFSDLKPAEAIDALKVRMQPPEDWDTLAPRRALLYTHQQWRSPSRSTGIGVAHVRLPFPLSAGALVWLAKQEYSKESTDGRVLDEWMDTIGRRWFEAENNKYHVRGYVVLEGMNAWFIYSGYKTGMPLDGPELTLAAKCVETVVPFTGRAPAAEVATGDERRRVPTLRRR